MDEEKRRVKVERVLAPTEVGVDMAAALKAKLAKIDEATEALDGWHPEAKQKYDAEMAAAIASADVKKVRLAVPKDAAIEEWTLPYHLPDGSFINREEVKFVDPDGKHVADETGRQLFLDAKLYSELEGKAGVGETGKVLKQYPVFKGDPPKISEVLLIIEDQAVLPA